jgi:hypothetical protein
VTLDGVCIDKLSLLKISDYILETTIAHKLVPTVTSSLPLLGRGFQWRTFAFLWIMKMLALLSHSKSNCLAALHDSQMRQLQLMTPYSRTSQSHVTRDGQSASLYWCQAPGPRDQFFFLSNDLKAVADLLTWAPLPTRSHGRKFSIVSGPRQCSLSRVQIPRDS